MTIAVDDRIELQENEITVEFIRASGPGGQNVNKVSTAVKLYFDITASSSLAEPVKERLRILAGNRVTSHDVLIIDARRFRTQEQNRRDAVERLVRLIQKAALPPKPRHATRPTAASRIKRVDSKIKHSRLKRFRQKKISDNE